MAISSLGFSCRPHLRLPYASVFHCIRQVRFISVAALDTLGEPGPAVEDKHQNSGGEDRKWPEWKKLNSKELGISTSKIARPTRKVLNDLRQRGYEVYLVGGCVRDLILKRTPKDFDIITSAELREVVRAFSQCEIVGRRFPICHVHVEDTIVEVSSFSTIARGFNRDFSYDAGGPVDCDEKDYIRWQNCLQRDFTINGLLFDPYARIIYDYIGGLEDIRKAKVQTVIPASISFQEDCARILRAIRISARLKFCFSKDTAHFIKNYSRFVLRLDKLRIMMEMNYMLAYGSAEASLRRLWKFGLLEVLLPIQAAYFIRLGFGRCDKRSNMLLTLFLNLDKLLAPDRPCHSSLWVAILAFHKALTEQPRHPLVVAAFCLTVHNGGNISQGVNIAKMIEKPYDSSFHELSAPLALDSKMLMDEVVDLARSVKRTLCEMSDEYFVSQALVEYPQAPYSDLVFISLPLYLRACRIFECVRTEGTETGFIPKKGGKIDYESLALGRLQEVRHVFARIVFDTVYPLNLT